MKSVASTYEAGKFNRPTWEVKKFKKGTSEEIPGQFFHGSSQSECEEKADELNAELTTEEKGRFEFRCCPLGPSHRMLLGEAS